MAGSLDKLVAPGRHTRRPGRAGLRRVCLAALIMLVAQYAPRSQAPASWFARE
jgi:hypothetical protein